MRALTLLHDGLEPRRLHFQDPRYLPGLFEGSKREWEERGVVDRDGLMADVPAPVAWQGRARVWAQPPRLRGFYEITLLRPGGELVLTRASSTGLFSELNVKPLLAESLSAVPNPFGEGGGIDAGPVTVRPSAECRLQQPATPMPNFHGLINPAMPRPGGK